VTPNVGPYIGDSRRLVPTPDVQKLKRSHSFQKLRRYKQDDNN